MTRRYRGFDDLTLPFIFVPHGEEGSPAVAEFKARHPGWFSIPARFVPEPAPEPAPDTVSPTLHDMLIPSEGPLVPTGDREEPARPAARTGKTFPVRQRADAPHSVPIAPPQAVRDAPGAFATSSPVIDPSEGYVDQRPQSWIGHPSVGTGECVPLVQQATGAPHTSQWRRGALVKGDPNLRPGTAIATFDEDGHYGNHTDGRSHAAIYLWQDANGIVVIDQWVLYNHGKRFGLHSPRQRTISFNDHKTAINNGNLFYVVK